ncbi:tetratricopeptide repeat protein [Campylobacter mucosalis]|uniref:tetratricopeptide repeat protein n=1 Tax=Campylobacter mucosalis TaxID=202 RepID=UPI00146FF7A3|nr:hypothetical protein [Campylobacter mucosalis]
MAIPKFTNNIGVMIKNFQDQAIAFGKSGNLTKALENAMKAYNIASGNLRTLEIINAIVTRQANWDKAIEFGIKALKIDPKSINALDTLAHAYGTKREWEKCGEYGKRALELRDSLVMQNFKELPKILDIKNPQNRTKNIISFSLFGDKSYYCETAVINAQILKDVYPEGWICRFYVDESVPQETLKRLEENHAQIVFADENMKKIPKTLWRFFAADDADVCRVVFRDADSIISDREAWCINEWVQSNKLFHIIRDGASYTELIMAGAWGMVAGVINMRELIGEYFASAKLDGRFDDQFFLRHKIWAYAKQNLLSHDRIFNFLDAKEIAPNMPFDYSIQYIGGCEGNALMHSKAPAHVKDGTIVTWRLYTKILPNLGKNLELLIDQNERFICEYKATVQNGQISFNCPIRYAKGFSNGLSRLQVIE